MHMKTGEIQINLGYVIINLYLLFLLCTAV